MRGRLTVAYIGWSVYLLSFSFFFFFVRIQRLYINDLFKEVKTLNLGVKVAEELISILAFADDIVIIANCEKELQQILKCFENWCKNWRLKLNTEKNNIVHFRRK